MTGPMRRPAAHPTEPSPTNRRRLPSENDDMLNLIRSVFREHLAPSTTDSGRRGEAPAATRRWGAAPRNDADQWSHPAEAMRQCGSTSARVSCSGQPLMAGRSAGPRGRCCHDGTVRLCGAGEARRGVSIGRAPHRAASRPAIASWSQRRRRAGVPGRLPPWHRDGLRSLACSRGDCSSEVALRVLPVGAAVRQRRCGVRGR